MIYKSKRIGKNGKPFFLYKIQTLKNNVDFINSFAHEDQYTRFGRFLRKTKIDELPALLNVLRGEMNIFGYRPEEKRTIDFYSESIKELLFKEKPGLIDLSSIFFYNEEFILQLSDDPQKTYFEKIFPIKMVLRAFYFENKCFPLKVAIGWMAIKKIIKSIFQ